MDMAYPVVYDLRCGFYLKLQWRVLKGGGVVNRLNLVSEVAAILAQHGTLLFLETIGVLK